MSNLMLRELTDSIFCWVIFFPRERGVSHAFNTDSERVFDTQLHTFATRVYRSEPPRARMTACEPGIGIRWMSIVRSVSIYYLEVLTSRQKLRLGRLGGRAG